MLEELSVPPPRDPKRYSLRLDAEGLRTCASMRRRGSAQRSCVLFAALNGTACQLGNWETDGYDVVFHGYMMLREP